MGAVHSNTLSQQSPLLNGYGASSSVQKEYSGVFVQNNTDDNLNSKTSNYYTVIN